MASENARLASQLHQPGVHATPAAEDRGSYPESCHLDSRSAVPWEVKTRMVTPWQGANLWISARTESGMIEDRDEHPEQSENAALSSTGVQPNATCAHLVDKMIVFR